MTDLSRYIDMPGRCFVVGDIMLDKYISGDVNRVSPEAPVPVIRVGARCHVPGGAANVAAGIRALGAQVMLAGVIGNDAGACVLRETFDKTGIIFAGIESDKRLTTEKTRVIGNGSQIARFDDEDTREIGEADEAELIRVCENFIGEADVVVISDYDKGVCTPTVCRAVITYVSERKIPVIVDPKQYDWTRYSGAYLVAPNFSEMCEAVKFSLKKPMENLRSDARMLLAEYGIENILVTRSKDGMTLINEKWDSDYMAQARDVFDVSGAGDTVIAALSAFTAAGMPLREAVNISNIAAGIAVSKPGTYAVAFRELDCGTGDKIIPMDSISDYAASLRKQGKKIVFTNGCFDIIHAGHIGLLKRAKQLGDTLIVGLNTDASVKRLKGKINEILYGDCE